MEAKNSTHDYRFELIPINGEGGEKNYNSPETEMNVSRAFPGFSSTFLDSLLSWWSFVFCFLDFHVYISI